MRSDKLATMVKVMITADEPALRIEIHAAFRIYRRYIRRTGGAFAGFRHQLTEQGEILLNQLVEDPAKVQMTTGGIGRGHVVTIQPLLSPDDGQVFQTLCNKASLVDRNGITELDLKQDAICYHSPNRYRRHSRR